MKEYLDEVLPETIDGVKRVNAIIADVRRFARGDPDPMVPYALNDQVQAALRIAQPQLRHRAETEVDLGAVRAGCGHPQQLVQVFLNLLVNAGDAVPKMGGRIFISTGHKEGLNWARVRDNGSGIKPEVRKELFQPFFTTKPVGKGTGLGLSTAYGIVKSHGGWIDVESNSGSGATFTVWLPSQPGVAVENAS